MIEKIWEVLTTLTEEAQNSALTKCQELGFDPERGVVSLEESFINLNAARLTLMDAIEKRKLTQLPITVQQNLLKQLQAIAESLNKLTGGADDVVNLVNRIEQLNFMVWQYRLDGLSDEVLGYQTKVNQLKNQELEAGRLTKQLEEGLSRKQDLEQLIGETKKSVDSLKSNLTESEEKSKKIAEYLNQATDANQKAAATLATIQQSEKSSTDLLASTKTSNAEVKAIEDRIKKFHGEIDNYEKKISTMSSDADNAVKKNRTETEELISTLRDLEDNIKEQITKATGYSLFHSFQTRQEALIKSKNFWRNALFAVVALTVGWSLFLWWTTSNIDSVFYLKLSMSLPLIYAITFCNLQYSRERKLEEEYAFKANISISLVPYKDLVEKLINKEKPQEIEKFATFIIESVNKVFASPTDKIFDSERRQRGLTPRNIQKLAPFIEAAAKLKG